jgi:arylsulfatase A-like enzyme
MDQFLQSPNLDVFYDVERSTAPAPSDRRDPGLAHEVKVGSLRGGRLDDAHTTDQAIAWIERQVQRDKPFFLSMNFQSSHFPYTSDPEFPRPFQPAEIDFDASFVYYPKSKAPIVRNAYYNALHKCDAQIGRLVHALRELGRLDNTILVVMGENGEAFHENGAISHAGKPVEPTVRVAMVIHAPRFVEPAVIDYPTELIDTVPTVLGLMGWPRHPNHQGINILASDRPPFDKRLLFLHTENVLSKTDVVLYQGRWKLLLDRNTGHFEFYDLATDPEEKTNLIETEEQLAKQLGDILVRWRKRQLAYYHYPQYYLSYYPPRPPVVTQNLRPNQTVDLPESVHASR